MSFGLKAVVFNVISFQSRKFLKNKNYWTHSFLFLFLSGFFSVWWRLLLGMG